jgi:LEA14-like dessication related protein
MIQFHARGAGALLLCAVAAGCASLQRQAFQEPEVVIDAAAIAGGLQSQHFDLDLAIYNPNHYRLDASRFRYRVLLDSVEVATGTLERRVTLNARDSAVVRVPVDVNPRAFPTVIAGFLRNMGSIPFQLGGEMRIETIFGGVNRAFEQTGTYDPLRGHVTIFKRK